MLLRNVSNSLFNGARGVVKGFYEPTPEEIQKICKEKGVPGHTLLLTFSFTSEPDVDEKWFRENKYLPIVSFQNKKEVKIEPESFLCQIKGKGWARRTQM